MNHPNTSFRNHSNQRRISLLRMSEERQFVLSLCLALMTATLTLALFRLGWSQQSLPAAVAETTTVRPLDWTVTVQGDHAQGEWIEFTHTLGPNAQTLHPLKVYSQDYTTLHGVGKYAIVSGQGLISYDIFGDGRDGVMPASGNLNNNNGFGIGVVNSGSAGATNINVTDAQAVRRINPGDAVLLHQTQGVGAGCWELNQAVADFNNGTGVYQLARPLQCNYASGGNSHAQIVRVPQYSTCNVNGTVTPLAAWNGSFGGIFAVMCNSAMNVAGGINASNNGFQGGSGSKNSLGKTGQQGESHPGVGISCGSAGCHVSQPNGGGGGGGGEYGGSSGGGGGAGYGTAGTSATGGGLRLGTGGEPYGDGSLTSQIHLGSGGGGGYENGNNPSAGGNGGNGGGIILIWAKSLQVAGSILSNGGNGQDSASYPGGAGAGGSIKVVAESIDLGVIHTEATGGIGGTNPIANRGGDGGVGRIRVEYCTAFAGSTNPTAGIQKLNCYLAEQTEVSPYNAGRLKLPETATNGTSYQVQYSRQVSITVSGAQSTTLRVPAGQFSAATLDALLMNTASSSLTFQIDLGVDETWDWTTNQTVNRAATLSSPDLAAAFNRYWTAQGSPTTGELDVPIVVWSSQPVRVFLTNLVMQKIIPPPTLTATPTPTATDTPTPTATSTSTNTPANPPTPTVTSTPPPADGADEPNDTCAQARAIPTDGGIQEHTFHQAADVDWVRFDTTGGLQYRIEVQAPVASPADVDLELYTDCNSLPAERWNESFSPGVRLNFTSPQNGPLYLRLTNYDATVAGAHVAYHLAVYTLEQTAPARALIIVAGRLKGADRLQTNIHNISQAIYTLFQSNGYDNSQIQYLATDSTLPGYTAAATKSNLQAAITTWAAQQIGVNGVLTLYLIDHGHPNLFYLDELSGQRVTPTELDEWLGQLEMLAPDAKINVIIEACQSGSFIQAPESISKPGRLIITSTDAQNDAKASRQGAYFSDHFLTGLHQGFNLYASFWEARRIAQTVFSLQTAWVDGDGDGQPNELEDAAVAAGRGFNYPGTFDDPWPPHIFAVDQPTTLVNFTGQFQADVRDDVKVRLVWGVVYPPSYTPPPPGQELQPEVLPTFLFADLGENRFAGEFTGFTEAGVYRIVVQAEDNEGLKARPVVIEINAGIKVFLPVVAK